MRAGSGWTGLILGVALAWPAHAAEPLWEVGVFGGAAWTPDYPAADENSFNGIPAPYVVYRGDVFRLGDGSLASAAIAETSRFELDISIDGSFGVESDDNEARRGMPDLDFLGEIGPELSYRLSEDGAPVTVTAELELRAVFSTDLSSLSYEGIAVNSELKASWRDEARGLSLSVSAGPILAFDGLNDYFYEVAPAFALPGRPAYAAEEGYLGTEATLSAGYQASERVRLFAAVQVGVFSGSANEDSPLFRDDVNAGVFVGLAWTLWESETRAAD